MMSQKRLNSSLNVFDSRSMYALQSMLHRLLDIEMNDPRKIPSPRIIDKVLVKAPLDIKAATSPNGLIPPRRRYPAGFRKVQKASQKQELEFLDS